MIGIDWNLPIDRLKWICNHFPNFESLLVGSEGVKSRLKKGRECLRKERREWEDKDDEEGEEDEEGY